MKLAITSVGKSLDSAIDERFGRARYFLVVESDTGEILDFVDNVERQHAAHGAGVQAAQAVTEKNVEWLITGNIGPNAFSLLSAAGVKIGTGAEGTVRDVLEKFKAGGFEAAGGATSGGHMR
jgi:predicted Fe-Mo cluster-binding NifX family protein